MLISIILFFWQPYPKHASNVQFVVFLYIINVFSGVTSVFKRSVLVICVGIGYLFIFRCFIKTNSFFWLHVFLRRYLPDYNICFVSHTAGILKLSTGHSGLVITNALLY